MRRAGAVAEIQITQKEHFRYTLMCMEMLFAFFVDALGSAIAQNENALGYRDVLGGINGDVIAAEFQMQMRTGGISRGSDLSDNLSLLDDITCLDVLLDLM